MNRGMTLIEVLIVMAIMSGIVFVVAMFGLDISDFGIFLGDTFTAQQEIQLTLTAMATEIRSMGPSENGSYAIESAASNSFTFYSDVDGDDVFERVRYFIVGNTLRRGIIEPTGNPATYSTFAETTRDLVHDLVVTASPSMFIYFDGNYDGSQNDLPIPVNIALIRLVKVSIVSDRTPNDQEARIGFSMTTVIRNLKDD